MSDAILRALFHKFNQTSDPEIAVQFMRHYMRTQTPTEVSQETAKQLSADQWTQLALQQGWGDPESILEDVLRTGEPFIYGYQCPCGSAFLNSVIQEVTGFDDVASFGIYCKECRKYGCGQCNLIIAISSCGSESDYLVCDGCFLNRVVSALQIGVFKCPTT